MRFSIVSSSCSLTVLTLNVWGPSYLSLARSISWLLMPWLLTSPGHHQPWYWLCRISGPGLTWGRILSTCVSSMWSNDIKCKYMFMFPLKNLARKGLISNLKHLMHTNWHNVDDCHGVFNSGMLNKGWSFSQSHFDCSGLMNFFYWLFWSAQNPWHVKPKKIFSKKQLSEFAKVWEQRNLSRPRKL